MKTRATLWAMCLIALPLMGFIPAPALALEGSFVLSPYEGSTIRVESEDAFNEYVRIIGFEDGQRLTEQLEGRLVRQRYDNPPGRSSLEIVRNYQDALVAEGFAIEYSCSSRDDCGRPANDPSWMSINGMNTGIVPDIRYFTASRADADRTLYVSVAATDRIHYLHTLETAAMETGMVSLLEAGEMEAALAREGKIAIYGIYFDTDRAEPTADSLPQIEQLAALLDENSGLSVLIVGHTDNQGDFDYNLALSQRRAQAVVDALSSRYGITADRLTPAGAGMVAPVASNRTDAGRTQNRRVEIVER